jgi:hypothetical protein
MTTAALNGCFYWIHSEPLPNPDGPLVAAHDDDAKPLPLARYRFKDDTGENAQVDAYSGYSVCNCDDFRESWHCAHVEIVYLRQLAPLGSDVTFTPSCTLAARSGGAR